MRNGRNNFAMRTTKSGVKQKELFLRCEDETSPNNRREGKTEGGS